MTTDIAIRILKTASCPSLSGKSKLTYEIACSNEAVDDQSEIALRIATNTGGGFFSDEWLPLAAVEKIVTGATDLTSTTLHPLFKGKSINTAGFLLAVLKHEGAVQLQAGKTRLYEVGDFEGFMESVRGLMQVAPATKGKAPKVAPANPKAVSPAAKAVSSAAKSAPPAAKATSPARKAIQRAVSRRV